MLNCLLIFFIWLASVRASTDENRQMRLDISDCLETFRKWCCAMVSVTVTITVTGTVTWLDHRRTAMPNVTPTESISDGRELVFEILQSSSPSIHSVMLQSALLPLSLYCSLKDDLVETVGSCNVAIPSHFPVYHSDQVSILTYLLPVGFPDFFICYVVLVGDTEYSSETSCSHRLVPSPRLCFESPELASMKEKWNKCLQEPQLWCETDVLVPPNGV